MLLSAFLCLSAVGLRTLLLDLSTLSGQKCVHYAMIML